jgi:hypothetical protein
VGPAPAVMLQDARRHAAALGGRCHKLCCALPPAETMNSWTMIAGSVISIAMLCWTVTSGGLTLQQLLPFLTLTAAAVAHCPFSVSSHGGVDTALCGPGSCCPAVAAGQARRIISSACSGCSALLCPCGLLVHAAMRMRFRADMLRRAAPRPLLLRWGGVMAAGRVPLVPGHGHACLQLVEAAGPDVYLPGEGPAALICVIKSWLYVIHTADEVLCLA